MINNNIVIMSVNRLGDYIHKTIASIKSTVDKNCIINVCVGTDDDSYLEKYKSDEQIKIKKFVTETYNQIKNCSVKKRMVFNYDRCLSLLDENEDVLIFEDDISLTKGWVARLNTCITELKEKHQGKFILNFFTSQHIYTDKTKFYTLYPTHQFMGSVGIYYPKETREKFLNYIRSQNSEFAHDVLLKKYLIETNTPAYVTIPCLLQHTGYISTWQPSNKTLRAIEFKENLE